MLHIICSMIIMVPFQFVAIENNSAVNILVLAFLVPKVCGYIVCTSRDRKSGHMVCMCSSSVDSAKQFIRRFVSISTPTSIV